MAKRIVQPLNALNLDHPLENDAYEELYPLLRRIQQQRGQINAQVQELRTRADEFEQIIGSMNEGLIVLDQKGTIICINPAAQRLFGTYQQDWPKHSQRQSRRRCLTNGDAQDGSIV